MFNNIINHKSVYKYDLKTVLESQIVSLGYITSDINFDTTLRLIKENNYTQKMFEKMQDTPQSRKIYDFVNDYIERRLSNEKE